jgi:alpha-beta hydrolase superfamily lysophospholipase
LDAVGYIGKDGFNNIVEDEFIITGIIKREHPDLPVMIIGHSFGSFVAQEYITRYSEEIAGVILSGSSLVPESKVKPAVVIASVQRALLGEKRKSNLLDKLSFGSFNQKFANVENEDKHFAWLSRDREEVQKYVDDPYCGTVFSVGYYYYFYKELLELFKAEKVSGVSKKLPILIISGSDDPVGGFGAGVEALFKMYHALGMSDLELKLYQGARHEIFNEINRSEVFDDVVNWMDQRVKS